MLMAVQACPWTKGLTVTGKSQVTVKSLASTQEEHSTMAPTPIRTFTSTPTEAEIYAELRRLNPHQPARQHKLLAAVLSRPNCDAVHQVTAYAIAEVAGPEMRALQPTPRTVMKLAAALRHYSETFIEITREIEAGIAENRRTVQ